MPEARSSGQGVFPRFFRFAYNPSSPLFMMWMQRNVVRSLALQYEALAVMALLGREENLGDQLLEGMGVTDRGRPLMTAVVAEVERWVAREEAQGVREKQNGAEVMGYICEGCGVRKEKMKLCSGCRKARWCGEECVKANWRNHKAACKAAQAGGAS